MHYCLRLLLEKGTTPVPSPPDAVIKPHEEMIEGLCKLLTTVGRMLDDERAKARVRARQKRELGC
jgi:hypothetical protein